MESKTNEGRIDTKLVCICIFFLLALGAAGAVILGNVLSIFNTPLKLNTALISCNNSETLRGTALKSILNITSTNLNYPFFGSCLNILRKIESFVNSTH